MWEKRWAAHEDFLEVDGISNLAQVRTKKKQNLAQVQIGIIENLVSLEEGNEGTLSVGMSHESSPLSTEKIPKTPLVISASNFQSGAIEIVLPFEKDLVEAQNSWNIGKTLGFKVNNEKAIIEVISKIRECQDFSLPTRRGHHKKNK